MALLQVRLEFLRTISDWMLNLRERVDHEPRLLPYALGQQMSPEYVLLRPPCNATALRQRCAVTGLQQQTSILTGDAPVVEEALVLLDKLGEQYEKDHANDLKDTVYYLPHEVTSPSLQQPSFTLPFSPSLRNMHMHTQKHAHGLGWQSVLQEEAAVAKGKAATSSPQGGLPCSKNGTISGKEEGNQEQHQLASFAFVSSHQAVTRTEGSAGVRWVPV
eukprot:scaffold34905_cov17-Tisochrysis_lutea.AAC.1